MTPAERFSISDKWKVPTWPAPNSARIDPAFRWLISTPDCVPRASRYLFSGAPNGIDIGEVGIIDMVPTGAMRMNGQTPINTEGRQVFLECTGFAPPDLGPEGFSGQYVTFLWTRVGFTPTRATYWRPLPELGFPYGDFGPSQTNKLSPLANKWDFALEQLGENPDFDANWLNNFGWQTISACNLELPGTPAPEDLFAEFNGVDSYINLENLITGMNSSFTVEARIRLHDTTGFWPILGREFTGGFFGMDEADFIFGFLRLATSWVPVLDEWFQFRCEFDQVLLLNYELFIDDVKVMMVTTNRQFSTFNNLGVYRRGVSNTIWGNFDMQDLFITTGVDPTKITVLDMPLRVNALDQGPSGNHGTTFNMALPST